MCYVIARSCLVFAVPVVRVLKAVYESCIAVVNRMYVHYGSMGLSFVCIEDIPYKLLDPMGTTKTRIALVSSNVLFKESML